MFRSVADFLENSNNDPTGTVNDNNNFYLFQYLLIHARAHVCVETDTARMTTICVQQANVENM